MKVFCSLIHNYMESLKSQLLKSWVRGQLLIYPVFLGIVHPLVAHGFTGDHGKLLSASQFIMHTISLFILMWSLSSMQRLVFVKAGLRRAPKDLWMLLVLPPAAFWLGYYTFYIPFDILFLFLTIGLINAARLKSVMRSPARWMWQCLLGYLLAAAVGIVVGIGAYLKYYKDFPGILRDMAIWLSISIPAALVLALYFRYVLGKQLAGEAIATAKLSAAECIA